MGLARYTNMHSHSGRIFINFLLITEVISLQQVGEWHTYKIVFGILRKTHFSLYAVAIYAQFQSCNQQKTTPNKLTGEVLKFGMKSTSLGVSLGLGWPLGLLLLDKYGFEQAV